MSAFKFPVWGTQGGGLVRAVSGKYIFVTEPNCPGLTVGDEMPEEWGLAPANDLARQEDGRQQREMEMGFNEFFDTLILARKESRITHEQALNFFPEEVRERCG